jgi:outer membrane protein TolC
MGNLFFNTVGGLTAPLFTGGRLEHQENAAQARLDAAEAAYRNVVISAFRDVSDTLRAIQSDAETLKEKEAAEDAAGKNLALAREQLKLGDGSILYVLDAEHRYALARQATVKARVARIADSAALFQALGGGWWHMEAPAQDYALAVVAR